MVKMMRTLEAGVLLLALPFTHGQAIKPVSSPDSSKPMVDLGYAKYQGRTNKTAGINYFRSIQYDLSQLQTACIILTISTDTQPILQAP
jgi:hypothetical protein